MTRPALLLAALLWGTPAHAETPSGLPYLTDADTVTISGTRICLAGIDAPEMGQTCLDASGRDYRCGEAAREALTIYAAGKEWRCELQTKARTYGRRVGACFVGGENVQAWLVRQGWALDWRRFSRGAYAGDEAAARAAGRGLWAGSFLAPWNVRRHRRCGARVLGSGRMPAADAREKLCQ